MRYFKHLGISFRAITAYLLLALCLIWSTLPFGGVATWAKASIIGLNLFTSGVIFTLFMLPASSNTRPWYRSPLVLWYGLLLIGACFIIPLPTALHELLHSPHVGSADSSGFRPLSIHPADSRMTLYYWISLTTLGGAVLRLAANRRMIFNVLHLAILLGLVQALGGLVGAQTGILPDNPFTRWRLTSTFSSSNSFGGLLAITIPVTAGCFIYQIHYLLGLMSGRFRGLIHLDPRKQQNVLFCVTTCGILFLQVFALLLSASRGAILSVAISLALLMVVAIVRPPNSIPRRKVVIGLGLCLVLAGGLSSGAFKVFLHRIPQLGSMEYTLPAQGRTKIWSASMNLVNAHPTGVGPGCYKDAIPAWQPPGFGPSRINKAHNDYLQIVCETGWVGGALFAGFMLGCVAYFARAFKRIKHPFRWLYGACTLGVLAPAIHAAVDFNLSSRPGVGVPFAFVLGTAFACRRLIGQQGYRPSKVQFRPLGNGMRWLVPMWLLTLFAGADLFRQAASYWQMETAWTRAGGQTDPYFWLPGHIELDGSVDDALRAASTWSGKDPHLAASAYRTKALEQEQVRQTYFNTLYREAPAFSLTRLDQLADQVIAPQRIALAEAHAQAIDHAYTQLPHDAELRMTRAVIRVQETIASGTGGGAPFVRAIKALAEAERAAPNDAQVLTALASEWSRLAQIANTEVLRTRCLRDLKRVSVHAFEESTEDPRAVALAWSRAGQDISELAPIFPTTHFMDVYRDFQSEWTSKQTLAFIDTWQERLRDTTAWRKRFRTIERFQEYQSRYLTFTHREKSRWLIRNHKFEEFQAHRRHYHTYMDEVTARTLESLGDLDSSSRLYLQEAYETRGLNFLHMLRLAELSTARRNYAAANEMIADAVLRQIRTNELVGDFPLHTESLPRDKVPAAHLLDGLAFYQQGERVKAMTAIQQAIDGMRTRQFKPSAYYFSLLNHVVRKNEKMALASLEQVSWALRDDPDLEPLGRAAGLIPMDAPLPNFTPALRLGTQHGGGAVELLGATFRPPTSPQDQYVHASVYLRFWRSVPVDLEVHVFIQHPHSNEAAHREKLPLAKEKPLFFNEGTPLAGSVLVWHTRIPLRSIRPNSTCCIGFRKSREKTWMPTTEGIPYIVLEDATGLFR
ncbi:MAG: O-antigen ligase family protein [Verrucomicrobiota bacterium]